MEKMQKLAMMDKIMRELDDLKSSQTSVLKKIAQIEAENINLGVQLLDKELPDLHENVDKGIEEVSALMEKFQAHREKFVKDNKLATAIESAAVK
jgi:predicted  nucleic acid-binding Zn-ribbon protein